MRAVAKELEGSIEFPLLVQGTRSKSYLLQRFKQFGNGVLLGTSSFWEGVDVEVKHYLVSLLINYLLKLLMTQCLRRVYK